MNILHNGFGQQLIHRDFFEHGQTQYLKYFIEESARAGDEAIQIGKAGLQIHPLLWLGKIPVQKYPISREVNENLVGIEFFLPGFEGE